MEKIIGIIAEFNPFHNGHKKLVNEVKNKNKNSTIVCAMSGNFVQRGEIAIYDKWKRAEIAINAGIDIVTEIPPFFVLNHANIFAKKSVEILNSFNVSEIYFGSETMDIEEINKIADILLEREEELNLLKNKYHSLPKAFEKLMNKNIKSNDLLGICYVLEAKKMKLNIKFCRVERIFNEEFTSASLLREKIKKESKHLEMEDYSDLIIGKLVTSKSDLNIIKYLKNIILNKSIKSFDKLIELAANKSYTKSSLRREIIKFILDIKQSNQNIILACGEKGKKVLKNSNDIYFFRHNKNNLENLKVESFFSLKRKESISELLSKSMIIK